MPMLPTPAAKPVATTATAIDVTTPNKHDGDDSSTATTATAPTNLTSTKQTLPRRIRTRNLGRNTLFAESRVSLTRFF